MKPEDLLKTLGDKTHPTKLGEQAIEKQLIELPENGDKLLFSLGVESNAELLLFNDSNDFGSENPDGVLGLETNSLIKFDPTSAWLKYSTTAGLKTESGLKVESLGFSFGGKSSVQTTSYRKHSPTETLGGALLLDATPFKTIFSAKQVKELQPGEAVTFSLSGELNAAVTVTWSDIFSANLSILGELLNQNQLFKIKIGAEASASYKLKITDDFSAKIVCKANNVFGIYISKSKSTNQIGSIGVKVGAEFENKDEIKKVLTNVVEGYFGVAENQIQNLVAKVETTLTESEKEVLLLIAAQVGWDTKAVGLLDSLKTKYQEVKDSLSKKIEELATLKVSAGFKYDYNRISTSSILFVAETDGTGIDRFHLDILKMNVKPLIDSIRRTESVLKNPEFIMTDILKVITSSGFSIGFGKWTAGSDKKTEIKKIEQEDQSGHKKISYKGNRSYSEDVFGDGVKWKIDLNAEMTAFSQHLIPFANEFDYGFYLGFEWTEKILALDECAHFTDLAAIWGIIPESKIDAEAQRLYAELKDFREIKLSCEIKINAGAFEPILPALTKSFKNQDIVAFALGKSMPRWGNYKTRKDISVRTQTYGALWKSYLTEKDDPHPNTQLYADEAYRKLKTIDPELANAEMNYKEGVFKPYSFGSIINNNSGTFIRTQKLADGFTSLTSGNDSRSTLLYDKVIPKAFDNIQDFWRLPHHVKTLGTLVTMVLDGYPSIKQYVNRTASIKYKSKDGKDIVIIIGK
jgi:hypothetical protein